MDDSISIVMPVYNEERYIRKALEGLISQDYESNFEIIIVDGGSNDKTVSEILSVIEATPKTRKIKLLHNGTRYIPVSLNMAISHATGNYIVRLDGHTYPPSNYISRILEASKFVGDRGVIGGRCKVIEGGNTIIAAAIATAVSHPFGVGNAAYRTMQHLHSHKTFPIMVDTVPFGTFKRSLWEELGRYDEAMLANEDYDFCFRARKIGHVAWLVPDIVLNYVARRNLRDLWQQYVRYGFWVSRFFMKHRRVPAWRKIVPFTLIALVVILLIVQPIMALCLLLVHILASAVVSYQKSIKSRHGLVMWPILTIVFISLHWAYGLGNLLGLVTKILTPRLIYRPRRSKVG